MSFNQNIHTFLEDKLELVYSMARKFPNMAELPLQELLRINFGVTEPWRFKLKPCNISAI